MEEPIDLTVSEKKSLVYCRFWKQPVRLLKSESALTLFCYVIIRVTILVLCCTDYLGTYSLKI